MLSQQGPMMRRLRESASSMDWLVPSSAEKVVPDRPSGSAGWVAGYLTCRVGWGGLGEGEQQRDWSGGEGVGRRAGGLDSRGGRGGQKSWRVAAGWWGGEQREWRAEEG